MKPRRQRRTPFAAYAALIFNASLCIAPFIGARAISTAYGDTSAKFDTSSQALGATRQAMDTRFARLAAAGQGTPREVWSRYTRDAFDAGDLTLVKAFLLAAPAMLKGPDGDSLKARLAVANGGGDQTVIDASLAYLPEDLQEAYEKRNAPIVSMFKNAAPSTPADPADKQARADGQMTYDVLGDLRDLAITAARWEHDDKIDEFAFTLAGLGLTITKEQELREGASIVLSARRAQRLDPKFELYLQKKIFAAAPPQRLKRALAGEFQGEFGYVANTGAIERAFQASVDYGALESLKSDLKIIRDIAHETSPASAVAIVSQVKAGDDLKRAHLVAQAGGDRAVALAKYDGEEFLNTARSPVVWSDALRLQLGGLVLCLGLLSAIAANVVWRSFRRLAPRRRSAVYALDEVPGVS